jgi:hypothetical protein
MKISIRITLQICLFLPFLLLLAFRPKGDDPIDKLVASLQRWTDTIPQEKVYLHMDKPYYAVGDTIWFKGYVTIGSRHQLSKLSGALYVDLINEKDSVVKDLKLPITSGMVVGNFIVGDDYTQGSYRIRAYTQWMRNAGDDYFFDRTFTVGDLLSNNIVVKADYQYKQTDGKPILTALLNFASDAGKPIAGSDVHYQVVIDKNVVWSRSVKTDALGNIQVNISNKNQINLAGAYIHTTLAGTDKHTIVRDFPIKANLSQSDVQFFPESGNLVNGIASHVAFKAVGIDGLGIEIKGKVVDEAGNEVANISTLHAGMGSFLLRPESGKTYTANITFADGTTKTLALPKALNEGYVLSVYQPNKDSILVRINTKQPASPQTVTLVVHTNGETVFASNIRITNPSTSIWLEKSKFPTGIAQFTLFSSNNEPISERIAFVRSNDLLKLDIKTAKTTYSSKEHIKIELEATDGKGKPTFGNFSVAVLDESKVPVNGDAESTIFSNLLLTSDLKGYVEKPNYYFVKETDEVTKALDNLMLTQGYRRFTWRELNHLINTKPIFAVEGLGTTIAGKVITLTDKILPNANVSLVSVRAKIAKSTVTDANGRFRFDGIFMTDSIKIAIQARNGKSDKVKVILDSIPKIKLTRNKNLPDISTNVNGTLQAYLATVKKEDDVYEKLGQLDKVHRLREVQIRAKKVTTPPYKDQGMYRVPDGHASRTYYIPPQDDYPTPGIYLQGLLQHYVRFTLVNGGFMPDKLVFLDGRKLDAIETVDILNSGLDMEAIAKIDVVVGDPRRDPMAALLGGPAILIYTKRDYVRKNYTPATVNIAPKGFNRVREFYSPRYDRPGNANTQPDLRTTIYWNPYLKTDENGKTSFNYFNADGPGTYRVVIEGLNVDGQLGRQVFRYIIE